MFAKVKAKAKVKPKAKAKVQIKAKTKVQAKAKTIARQEVWAVQLSDTLHRSWKHKRGTSELVFNPTVVTGIVRQQLIRRSNKRFHDSDTVNLAASISNFASLKEGSVILGVKDKKMIDRVGRIVKIKRRSEYGNGIQVAIKWEYEPEIKVIKRNIFNTRAEIQIVTKDMLSIIRTSMTVSEKINSVDYKMYNRRSPDERWNYSVHHIKITDKMRSNLVALGPRFTNRTTRKGENIIPIKIVTTDKDGASGHTFKRGARRMGRRVPVQVKVDEEIKLSFEKGAVKKLPPVDIEVTKGIMRGKINLFYGTNRGRTKSSNLNKYFNDDLKELRLGSCIISIPENHKQGEIERPKFYKLEFSEDTKKHIVIKDVKETTEDKFFKNINNNFKIAKKKCALIFVHGYNTTFAEVARRAGQITWDTAFEGAAGFFSWPSPGKLISYFKDDVQVDTTIPDFEKFIEKIVFNTNVEEIHFIAHSIGNKLLTATLGNLADKPGFNEKLKIFQQIILAAPDVDQGFFRKVILPKFKNAGVRRTLYSSSKDIALGLSRKGRRGLRRLGQGGESLFVDACLDTIDASNVKAPDIMNHGYIFETTELLTDLHMLINQGLGPAQRRLLAQKKDNLEYWTFRK